MTLRIQSALALALLAIAATLTTSSAYAADPNADGGVIWLDHPAGQWTEGLPVGNGRLGAMVMGGVAEARWQFNEDSVWNGGPHSYAHAGAAKVLPKLRELLLAGKQAEAEKLAMSEFMSEPVRQRDYQPCGDLLIAFNHQGEPESYHRALDLDTARVTTSYRVGERTYTRTTLASYPDNAIVIRLSCDQAGGLSFQARLTAPHEQSQTKSSDDRTLLLTGRVGNSDEDQVRFAAHARITETDGQLGRDGDALSVSGASHATLLLTARSNHLGYRDLSGDPTARSEADLQPASEREYQQLVDRHTEDHQSLYRRVSLELAGEVSDKPTDQWVLASQGQADPKLAELLFDYGRYLMIASSRPGGQPANLQGLWNEDLQPAWGSKYTININTEMNYWLTDPCNLPECAEPLYDAIGELSESGAEVAREHYNAPGWVVHHNFDLWRGAAPINASNHGIWPTGGAWLCQHLWNRYAFSGDEEFLRHTAYPLLKGASTFFVDYLVEDPRNDQGLLISGPSNSPEQGGLVMGPTMDHQIIRALFEYTIAASEQLDVDADLRGELRSLSARIAPNQIGQHGQLQEWIEDVDNPSNRHRHVSHLWGVFPGDEITPDTPDLFDAARTSLEQRGDEGTGWSRAWKINLWARLRDGDRAEKVLRGLLTLTESPLTDYRGGGVYANLFDAHPPFQIDGNFGATSGICEMLVQSHRTTDDGRRLIELLPALPSAWPDGEVKGLCTRDGLVIDIKWKDGRFEECVVQSNLDGRFRFVFGAHYSDSDLAAGESTTIHPGAAMLR
ncbi:hypothetical protein Pla123a_13840 [Posidoniimonas polymericola]|uniref:Uncharacterized protein n=1 Tax=Posidoniimonas polymericola TaxID=2528002 RepID=A0A5C5YRV8_9BACT|nr:glycoside hydrolase family 95 protein [Posidoniimonas polymericola]TWT77588.1 hypothetical protein Pla123a_13840 [Posidoniimonas polymericola]